MIYSISRKIAVLSCFLLVITSSSAQTKTDSIQAFFATLNNALDKSDISLIAKDLNPNFSISVTSFPASSWYLEQIIKSNKIVSAHYESIKYIGNDTILVNALFNTSNNESVESVMAFDKENKLLFVDYFDTFWGQSRYARSEKKAEIPFFRKDGSIMLPIKLNNTPETVYFLLDTGANGMAIRKSLADSLNLVVSRSQNASVVGGSMQIDICSGNTVHLSDDFSLENQNIAIFEALGNRMDGIIGLNLANEYILNLDFDKQILSLFSFGDYTFDSNGEVLDMTIPSGIIMIPATLNIVGKKDVIGSFVFDTGAHYHAIGFEGFVRKNKLLLSGFKVETSGTTQSLGVVTPTFSGKCYSFKFGENIELHNMPITLQASSGRQISNDEPNGSIGIDLLSQFNITIDLLRKLIHLVPNSRMKE